MTTTGVNSSPGVDWQAAWQPVVDAVGRDFQPDETIWGADPVERGAVRRYLEPLEFDCALHTDEQVAQSHGHATTTMPATGVIAWTIPAAWRPGETLFDSADRDAQPVQSAINNADMELGPKTTGFFGTDIEVDFVRPVLVGERLGRRGKTLVSCTPKQTGVGRGAFMTWQSDVVSDRGDVVARIRIGTYAYVPHEPKQEEQQ